jgi:hypothetical protein
VLYASGSTGGLRLDHVVLQRLGSARDWIGNVNTSGTVTNQTDGPWSGFGMHGMSPEIHTAGGGGTPPSDPGTALMPQSPWPWPSDNDVGLTLNPAGTNWLQTHPDYVPVTPRSGFDRPTWNLVMKPDGVTRCNTSPIFTNPVYANLWVIAQGSGAITSSWLPYVTRIGQNSFPGTNTTVVRPATEPTMGRTKTTTSFGFFVPPCPLITNRGSLSKLGVVQAIVLNHPSG